MSRPAPARLLEAQLNHLVLPGRVPSKADEDTAKIATALTDRVIAATRVLRDAATQDGYSGWDLVRRILVASKEVNLDGKMDKLTLIRQLRAIEQGSLLILHITEQNAGLLIHRDHGKHGDEVIFEVFEASPRAEDVLAAESALQWDFPGSAVSLPYATFAEESFEDTLATFLEQCNSESIKRFAPRAQKASSNAIETRDTVDPAMISQLLMTVLGVHGKRIYPPLLRKRVRDDVCWASGAAESPWRRLPFWLVLRVGISRHLAAAYSGELGRFLYKSLLCVVLAELLEDAVGILDYEQLSIIKAKLARRLIKLKEGNKTCSPELRMNYATFFGTFDPLFQTTLRRANERINTAWAAFKSSIRKTIGALPERADPESTTLTLRNSGPYLNQVLVSHFRRNERLTNPRLFDPSAANQKLDSFATSYFSLAEMEKSIEDGSFIASLTPLENKDACIALSEKIDEYLTHAAPAYQSNPGESSLMILNVMDLWTRLDQRVTDACGLVLAFCPIVPPETLDVLQLIKLTDMRRLQEIQEYLNERQRKNKSTERTIFDYPAPGCFAERYYNESDHDSALHDLHQEIEEGAKNASIAKEREWKKVRAHYEDLERQIAGLSCLFFRAPSGFGTEHDDRRCTKCYLRRCAKRIEISVHEHPLPSDSAQAKAAIFELCCPQEFAVYRNVTWSIMASLAHPKLARSEEPAIHLRNYDGLEPFTQYLHEGVSLSSTTKSFLDTHYRGVRIPARLEDVCLRNGLKLAYFDCSSGAWAGRQGKPSFAHKCRVPVPLNSPFISLSSSVAFAPGSDGPSSNEVIASQAQCPRGVNVHEFMAFQKLFYGKDVRWPQILVELGSSNINFGTETTALFMAYLCTQAGPRSNGDPLRQIHYLFHEEPFCNTLLEQIHIRMAVIRANWRETNSLEMLITMVLRLVNLGSDEIAIKATKLLEAARTIAHGWMTQLRSEVHRAADSHASQRYSRFALFAALLCKRTFAMYSEIACTDPSRRLPSEPLRVFIESSITVQENMLTDPKELSVVVRHALIRDMKMTHRLRILLQRSLEEDPVSLTGAVDNLWGLSEGSTPRSYSALHFMEHPFTGWISFTAKNANGLESADIHYKFALGHLLINNRPMTRLPTKLRNSGFLQALFGQENLLSYPSPMPGMSHVLARCENGHSIHTGFRNGRVIVKATCGRRTLQLIPDEVFYNCNRDLSSCDLPASLVDNHFHWLDLDTGKIDVRPATDKWMTKRSNWTIDFKTRRADRRGKSFLVDPHSILFSQIAGVFHSFEDPRHLTVFQPDSGSLSVELRRLDLNFAVKWKGNLFCRELRAEIDRNQDAGTWYGLASKLVLRDPVNQAHRSIIVPMGPLSVSRDRLHVCVTAQTNGTYAQFFINDILGRVDSPMESWLLYRKAELHAYTSAIVCDRLTGRTGTEEALHCLASGMCQPWTPLDSNALRCLFSIAELTPKRDYYPKGFKAMQSISWDPRLTTNIQHEDYLPVVKEIWQQSIDLSLFASEMVHHPELRSFDSHLLSRGKRRRSIYERPDACLSSSQTISDVCYKSRDRQKPTEACRNVLESASLLRDWPSTHFSSSSLVSLLDGSMTIQGHGSSFDKVLLSDIVDVDFSLEWGSLVNLCRTSTREHLYRLSFLFAMMAFRENAKMEFIRVLIAFATLEEWKGIEPPSWPSYSHFHHNLVPTEKALVRLMEPCKAPYSGDMSTAPHLSTLRRNRLAAAEQAHNDKTERDCLELAKFLLNQWPCREPSLDGFSKSVDVDLPTALAKVSPEWLIMFQNMELSQYLEQVQVVLDGRRETRTFTAPKAAPGCQNLLFTGNGGHEVPSLGDVLLQKPLRPPDTSVISDAQIHWTSSSAATSGTSRYPVQSKVYQENSKNASNTSRELKDLENIVNSMTRSGSVIRRRYAEDLGQSLTALKSLGTAPMENVSAKLPVDLTVAIFQAREEVRKHFERIKLALEQDDYRARWLKEGGMWPCITPITLLEQLRSTATVSFGPGMKEALVDYALSITTLQRLLRLRTATMNKKHSESSHVVQGEKENIGHDNWDPSSRPDWLLLEIDSNMLIRTGQVDVALATISPSSRSNSVLQMNMGQGKTSCIMPMVAAVLADKERLVRVVVPKALLLQTAQLMQRRLGGLLGRRVKHIPFSRRTSTTPSIIQSFANIHQHIMSASGIMITLPDHIMSFQLSGTQRLSDTSPKEAMPMIDIQGWIRRVCRDIVDECDFTLAVRTQLIYPSGQQAAVDGHPHRWETIEAVLSLVEGYLTNLKQEYPLSMEVRRRGGGFPLISFLRRDVEDALTSRLVNDILHGRTSILPTRDCTDAELRAIKQFITGAQVQPATLNQIEAAFQDNRVAKQNLYLLRGLLVHRILLLALKKRWNVQFGLHPRRDPIAVPYHAKGVPSEQAEWGHPDVAILLTCLSFYYEGVSLAQLRESIQLVVNSDDPAREYDRWTVSVIGMPDSLRDWNIINVDDEVQLRELWEHLHLSIVVIDHHLNHFVFPRHAKQFKVKIQASGWDIPLLHVTPSTSLKVTAAKPLTTGFSGTNDNRTMLPLTIQQHDLPGLSHTNAEVLTYLLQPRNRQYILAADTQGRRNSEKDLLRRLQARGIRMLIDAGAQILEMDNFSVAKEWLKIDTTAKAALFFDQANKPVIVYRNKQDRIPLLASPFAENLEECLVYLDEAHTRGTDLKMPSTAQGALTLGLGQSKDHTVQAAMRLRQLATTQSVLFVATPDVNQSILDQRGKQTAEQLDSYDVICWLLEQTCEGLEQLQPLYYSQGMDFCRRSQASIDNPDILTDKAQRDKYLQLLRQTEHQTLQQLYKPKLKQQPSSSVKRFCPQIGAFMRELNNRREAFEDSGNAVHSSALEEVEQEREAEQEVEDVRELQRPVHFKPLTFSGPHEDIVIFVKTGHLRAGSDGYEQIFVALQRTALGRRHRIHKQFLHSKLFVSKEFLRTVEVAGPNDNFLRPVNWVLWNDATEAAMLIVPEEAEFFIPLLRKQESPIMHILTYSAPVTKKMVQFSQLSYFTIPPLPAGWKAPQWLSTEIGLFAGRLYFEASEHTFLRNYLGLPKHDDSKEGAEGDDDGSEPMDLDSEPSVPDVPCFTQHPFTFFREWLATRRKNQDFTYTPMGYVCQNKELNRDHPFFRKSTFGITAPFNMADSEKTNGTNINGTSQSIANGVDGLKIEDGSNSEDEDDDEDIWHDNDENIWHDDDEDIWHDANDSAGDAADEVNDGKSSGDLNAAV